MKRLLWVGLCFLSASWLFSIPIFVYPELLWSIFLIVFGIVCFIFSFWDINHIKFDKRYYLFIVPLLFSIFLINYPFNIGLIILLIGLISGFLQDIFLKFKKISSVISGLMLSGIILSIQASFYYIYVIFVSHGHRFDIISGFVSFFGKNQA